MVWRQLWEFWLNNESKKQENHVVCLDLTKLNGSSEGAQTSLRWQEDSRRVHRSLKEAFRQRYSQLWTWGSVNAPLPLQTHKHTSAPSWRVVRVLSLLSANLRRSVGDWGVQIQRLASHQAWLRENRMKAWLVRRLELIMWCSGDLRAEDRYTARQKTHTSFSLSCCIRGT